MNLQQALPGWRVYTFRRISSTEDFAKDLVRQQPTNKQPLLVVADEQTNGYGRYGRQFYSPQQTGIYLSIAMPKIDCPPGLLTISLAVTVVHVLEHYFPTKQLQLKWVNDIYLAQKKVAGLLVEQVAGMLICGIGINLSTTDFPLNLREKAGALTTQPIIQHSAIIKSLINEIQNDLDRYADGEMLDEYRERLMILHQLVTIKVAHRLITGHVRDITSTGALIVETLQGERVTINSGEVVKVNFNV